MIEFKKILDEFTFKITKNKESLQFDMLPVFLLQQQIAF
jgi:hypothetical protein